MCSLLQGEPGIPGQSGAPGKEGLIGPKVRVLSTVGIGGSGWARKVMVGSWGFQVKEGGGRLGH